MERVLFLRGRCKGLPFVCGCRLLSPNQKYGYLKERVDMQNISIIPKNSSIVYFNKQHTDGPWVYNTCFIRIDELCRL